jgi:aminoglycoside phosphotransferase (APT) family kinase protein
MVEYIDNCQRLNHFAFEHILVECARWLANFHTASEQLLYFDLPQGINKYDKQYYTGWARRAFQFAGPLHGRFPWFKDLCDHFEKVADVLLEAPQTVIHGEFYPKNILIRNASVFPIDWESAAVAVAQIDLSALTEGWPAETVADYELAYRLARWPEGAPADFDHMLDAARIYLHLRWLGDRPSWTMLESSRRHFEQLRLTGEKYGLI